MALDSVGYYALPIIPTFKGIERGISTKIKSTFGKTGTEAGKLMGDNVAKGLASARGKVDSAAAKHGKALDKVKTAAGQSRVEIEKLNEAINKGIGGSRLTSQTERVAAALRREATAAREARTAETQLANARRTLSSTSTGSAGAASGMSQAVESGGSSAVPILGKVGGAAGGAFMAGLAAVVSVAAVGALLKSALDVGIDFEKSVNMFGGVTNTGAEGMERMRVAARALGTDTQLAGVSARDAGNAMVELAKGGLTAEEAMTAARGTLQLATAGQLDAAEAAKYQSAVLNTWQMDATQATRVADLLAAGANASAADVSDLGMALQQGGAVAAGFGVSVEDSVTALTLFSKWGINGSDAGTMLKTSLQAITDQGNPAQGAIEQLGLKLYDAHGQFVGVESMMKQVGEASKRMTQEQFQAATAVLFGSDAMRASMVAANGGADAWDSTADAVTRSGAAADMAAANMQGLPGVVEALSNVWEGFKLKLFDVIDGPLITIGKWFTDVLSGGNEGATGFLGMIGDAFRGVGDAIGQHVMPALRSLWDALKGPLAQYGKQWVETFKSAMPVMKAVGAVIGVALLGAIKSLSITLPILIKGMTAVIAVMKGVYTFLGNLGKIVMTVGSAIGGAFVGAWNIAKGAISGAWSVIKPVFDGIKGAFGFLADAARYAFDTVILPMWHNLGVVAGAAWGVVRPIFDAMKTAWGAVAGAVMDFWHGAIVPAWEGIKGAFSAGWAAIQPIFENIKGAFQGVKDFVSGVWSGLAGIVKSAFDGIIGAIKGPLRTIGGLLAKVPVSIGPFQIPGAQAARDLGSTLQGLKAGTDRRGVLFGPGTGTSDSILGIDRATGRPTAFVSAGEGVVRADAMKRGGAAVVESLNRLPRMQTGGTVGPDVSAAQDLVGTAYSQATRNDCSGTVARVILKALGMDTGQGLMTTKNAESWLSALGFVSGKGGKGDITVGWYDRGPGTNDGHMAMTLSNGQAFEQGGGTSGGATLGAGATPGTSDQFDQFMHLANISPQGEAGSLSVDGSSGSGSIPAGSTAGTGPGGVSGYYTPESPQRIAELEAKVSEREARVREVEAKGDKATESERLRAERMRDEAKADLEEAKRGKFTESDTGQLGGTEETGGGELGEVGSIFKQFLSDTFGFGDLIPDPGELGIVKLASAMMGIKYTPQGKGFPWQTGYAGGNGMPGSGSPFAATGAEGMGGAGDMLGGLIPGLTIPPPPEGPMPHAGAGNPPGPIDQSTNVTINSPTGDPKDVENRTRWAIQTTPRQATYNAPQHIGGPG